VDSVGYRSHGEVQHWPWAYHNGNLCRTQVGRANAFLINQWRVFPFQSVNRFWYNAESFLGKISP